MTRQGKVSRFRISTHHEVSTKNGRKYISLASGDEAIAVFPSLGDEHVNLATERGRVLIFHVSEIPPKASAVRGVNAIRLEKLDRVLAFALSRRKRQGLRTWTSRGREVIVRETSYRPVKRGGKGQVVIRLGRLERYELPVLVYAPGAEEEEEEVLDAEETLAAEDTQETPAAETAAPPADDEAEEES